MRPFAKGFPESEWTARASGDIRHEYLLRRGPFTSAKTKEDRLIGAKWLHKVKNPQ